MLLSPSLTNSRCHTHIPKMELGLEARDIDEFSPPPAPPKAEEPPAANEDAPAPPPFLPPPPSPPAPMHTTFSAHAPLLLLPSV